MDDSLDPKIAELIDGWSAKRREFAAVDTTQFVAKVKESIGPEAGRRDSSSVPQSRRLQMAIAAVALVIGIFGVAQYDKVSQLLRTSSTPSYVTHAAAIGQRVRVTLPDGSKVLLAPATTIRYRANFGAGARTVEIDGQALFTVTNEGRPPFIVKIAGADARVLGTTFSVRKYSSDKAAKVTIADGKVEISSTGGMERAARRAVLTVGDKAELSNGEITLSHGVNIAFEHSWASGQLRFKDTPLEEVLADVSRMYGIDLRAEYPVAARAVTVTVGTNSIESLINILADISGSRAVRAGNTITFKER